MFFGPFSRASAMVNSTKILAASAAATSVLLVIAFGFLACHNMSMRKKLEHLEADAGTNMAIRGKLEHLKAAAGVASDSRDLAGTFAGMFRATRDPTFSHLRTEQEHVATAALVLGVSGARQRREAVCRRGREGHGQGRQDGSRVGQWRNVAGC